MAGSDHYRYDKHYVHLATATAAPPATTAASNCSRLVAVPTSGALVRPEEAAILLVVLAIWVAAIALFFDRRARGPAWRMLPYGRHLPVCIEQQNLSLFGKL